MSFSIERATHIRRISDETIHIYGDKSYMCLPDPSSDIPMVYIRVKGTDNKIKVVREEKKLGKEN